VYLASLVGLEAKSGVVKPSTIEFDFANNLCISHD